jgi:hypothetical protein
VKPGVLRAPVGLWRLDSADATGAIEWLMAKVVAAIDADGALPA